MQSWVTRSKKILLKMGKWLTVESHSVELPDGQVIDDWAWVTSPEFVNVVAVTVEGEVLIFRQVKYGLDGESLAPVGGYIEPGEDPQTAAKRELLEETGYTAETWENLGRYCVDPNRGVAMGTLFLARGASWSIAANADDLEEQQLLKMSVAEVEQALRDGEFQSLAWAANVALALLVLKHSC